jgi:hypothetical protein
MTSSVNVWLSCEKSRNNSHLKNKKIFAYRMYHFSTPRRLSELFINNRGGCSIYYPGIGDIEYVKDLMVDTVVTEKFNCSQFGPTYPSKLGWVSRGSRGVFSFFFFWSRCEMLA